MADDAVERLARQRKLEQDRKNAAVKAATSGSADTREAQLKTTSVQAKLSAQGITLSNLAQPTREKDNPPFIYPGDTFIDLGSKKRTPQRVTVQRGYIRRLHEFYEKMENAPTIFNRQCNFQFQPDTIVRSVAANAYETQYFFNQEPSQLSVPIPGQAGYSFKLLFNREAELVSRKYRVGNTLRSVDVSDLANNLQNDPEYFINNNYDPSWVCGLGVLADIMVLDAVVGQGFNKEMLTIVAGIANAKLANPKPVVDDSTADDGDKANTEAETEPVYWTEASLNPNLGNTAFLTPVPVRVVLSKWMIIEGFITSTNVNFHKFTKDYIPSQASVEITMQALYMGFEKKKTMLTEKLPTVETTASGSADHVGPVEQNQNVREQTQQGIDSFFKTAADQGFDRNSLNDIVFANSTQRFEFKIDFTETDSGETFRNQYEGDGNSSGGEVTFFYDAVIKMYWHKYAKGADQNDPDKARTVTKGRSAPSGSTIEKIEYDKPFPSELEYLKGWGTKQDPFIITSNGEIRRANIRFESDKWVTDNQGWTFVRPRNQGQVIIPYENEEFIVELTMRIQARRFESGYKSKQVVKGSWTLRLDDDELFAPLSISNSGWPENL